MEIVKSIIAGNDLVFAFLVVGLIMWISFWASKKLTFGKFPGVAIAIIVGLCLAFFGDKKGLSDVPVFSGLALLGGAMLRDFAIVATAMGVDLSKIKQAGVAGTVALLLGVAVSFFIGVIIAMGMGYSDAVSLATIGAGACTYIVGPVTGTALGATSDVMAISIGAGVVKSLMVTIGTPLVAKRIGLDNPHTALVFGGMMGTTSGVTAGLAATDTKLVPYGALTATFYTGLGCLLCPSILYLILRTTL